jgi:hypothetical protein
MLSPKIKQWPNDKRTMNWKGCERKRWWPNFGTTPFSTRDWEKQRKPVKTAGLRFETWARDLPNTKECYPLVRDVRSEQWIGDSGQKRQSFIQYKTTASFWSYISDFNSWKIKKASLKIRKMTGEISVHCNLKTFCDEDKYSQTIHLACSTGRVNVSSTCSYGGKPWSTRPCALPLCCGAKELV